MAAIADHICAKPGVTQTQGHDHWAFSYRFVQCAKVFVRDGRVLATLAGGQILYDPLPGCRYVTQVTTPTMRSKSTGVSSRLPALVRLLLGSGPKTLGSAALLRVKRRILPPLRGKPPRCDLE